MLSSKYATLLIQTRDQNACEVKLRHLRKVRKYIVSVHRTDQKPAISDKTMARLRHINLNKADLVIDVKLGKDTDIRTIKEDIERELEFDKIEVWAVP